jgi:excisionase family DNA binding protein
MKLLTTPEVADRLGITVTRVQQMIAAGRLPAEKMGRDYFIKEDDLKLVENRKAGRPPKSALAPQKRATGQKNATNGTPTAKKRGRKVA